jgi:succinyl-diaminopimelate desuccinylase
MLQKENNKKELVEILDLIKTLITFKTTPKNFSEFNRTVDFIKDYFSGTKIIIKEHRFNNFPALFISTFDTQKPKLLLQGHLDVVNGNDEQFTPKIIGNKLYGRGSVDMKTFVALAMKFIKDNPELDIGLVVTFDEEIGSENGAKKMVEEGYTTDMLFNGDGGYNYAVTYGEKGILKFNVTTVASPGRHPYPWEGPNAFDLFVEDYLQLESLFPENKLATDNDNWHSTYAIYDIKVSNDEFFTPNSVSAKISIYFTENITTEELFDKIKNTFKHSQVEKFAASERVFMNPNSKYTLMLKEIMEEQFGKEIVLRTENGSSDARFYANTGIPIVIVKVVGEDHHGDNEHILIDQLLPMYYSIVDFAYSYLEDVKVKEVHYASKA